MNGTKLNLNDIYPAVAEAVPHAREAITRLAKAAGISGEALDHVRLAVTEAVSNVVRHAYPHGSGEVELTAGLVAEELWVLVSDSGVGHQAESSNPGGGYGLTFIADACEQFTMAERSGGGTEVRMYFDLRGRSG